MAPHPPPSPASIPSSPAYSPTSPAYSAVSDMSTPPANPIQAALDRAGAGSKPEGTDEQNNMGRGKNPPC